MTYSEYCQNELGYTTISSFFKDFTLAEKFGIPAVKETYQRAFNEWKSDYKMLTELVMVLNHKIWQHYDNGNEEMSKAYNELWLQADNWGYENLKGDELDYFVITLD